MADLNGFATRMDRRAAGLAKAAPETQRAAARAALGAVVVATPADTGKARSNWRVSLGRPQDGTRPPYAPGEHLGLKESSNAEAAIAAGNAVIDQHQKGFIILQNNLDYIGRLNEGSSAQAPAGFIEVAVAAGKASVKNAKVL